MPFNSIEFLLLIGITAAAYWRLRGRARTWLLLVSSYAFYATFDWRFLGLLIAITAADHIATPHLVEGTDRKRRRILVTLIAAHVAVLAAFKYADFFTTGAERLLDAIGLGPTDITLELLLPIGLSFYTFQSLGYCMDVYRRRIEPERDPVVFATFIAFFPQLAAGPIERAEKLLPQLRAPRPRLRPGDLRTGVDLIMLGLVRKVVIADYLAPYVRRVFTQEEITLAGTVTTEHGWAVLLVGTFAFAAQLYGDFAGYSAMARGIARFFAIDLSVNFRQPFWSRSLASLWRSWHITLMQWFRDYLYVGFLGALQRLRWLRRREHRAALALLSIFVLAGLWHGANARWVLWGAITGVLVSVDFLRGSRRLRLPAPWQSTRTWATIERARTTGVFAFIAVLAGADTFDQVTAVWSGILTARSGPIDGTLVAIVAFSWIVLVATDHWEVRIEEGEQWWEAQGGAPAPSRRIARRPMGDVAHGVVLAVTVVALMTVARSEQIPFFYFDF